MGAEHHAVPVCDVIIVSHKSDRELVDCVSELLPGGGRLTVTIVDSGSDDISWAQDPVYDGVGILCIGNYGYGTSLNVGAARGTSPWLAFMNPDVRVTAPQVEQLVAIAAARGAAAIGPGLVDERGTVTLHSGMALKPYWARRRSAALPGGVREAEMIPGALLVVERGAFQEVGGFDEGFFLYSEEDDLISRMREAGHTAVLWDGMVVLHKGERSSYVAPGWRVARRLRGEYRYLSKHWSRFAALTTVAVDIVRACIALQLLDIPRLLAELFRDPRKGLSWPPQVRVVRVPGRRSA